MKTPIILVLVGVLGGVGAIVVLKAPEWASGSTASLQSAPVGSIPESERFQDDGRHFPRLPSKSGPRSVDTTDVVEVMQASVRDGTIRECSFEDVIEWSVRNTEEVEGYRYHIGEVVYVAETIFGKKNVRAKAYIKDNQVTKWVYAKTGNEID